MRRHPLLAYFVLTYAITWTIWSPIVASARGWVDWRAPYAIYYLGSFGPMLAALIVISWTEGRTSVRALLSRWLKWRVGMHYYAFGLVVPALLFMLSVLGNRLIEGEWPDLSRLGEADYVAAPGPAGVVALWLVTYGLGEETGWRGFALPRLQRTRSAASATLILGLLWGCWHLPAFTFRDTYIEMGMLGFPLLLVSIVFASMVFTWLYNSTEGSLLIVILFHAVFNWLSVSEAGGPLAAPIMTAPIILWALLIPRRYGLENAAPLPKQVA
jgi:membrane protease YdiL (CAAX protease family)